MSKSKHIMIVVSLLIMAVIALACGSASDIETTADVTETTTTTTASPSTSTTTLSVATADVTETTTTTTVSPSTTTTTLSVATATPSTTTGASNPSSTLLPFELQEEFTTNLNDRSTPLGMLCWANWEITRMVFLHTMEGLVAYFQIYEMIYPPDFDRDYTIISALEEIIKPEVIAIVDDPKLPVEVQPFAKKFFANAEAIIEQIEAVGLDQVDFNNMPYHDMDRDQNAFEKVAIANPDECVGGIYTQQ